MPQPETKIYNWGGMPSKESSSGTTYTLVVLGVEIASSLSTRLSGRSAMVCVEKRKEIIVIVNNVYEVPVAQRREERILKDEGFCSPEAEEVIEPGSNDEVAEPVEDLVCQKAWTPPTLKKCPLAKNRLRERRFHRE